MARKIKIYEDDINQQHTKVSKTIQEIENDSINLDKYKVLITDHWNSKAALKFINNIDKESKDLKKYIKDVKELQKYVKKTTEKVLQADKQAKKKISSIIEG